MSLYEQSHSILDEMAQSSNEIKYVSITALNS